MLLATSAIQSADSLDEFIENRFIDSPGEMPQSLRMLVHALKIFDRGDIALTEGRSILDSLAIKSVRLNATDQYDQKHHPFGLCAALTESFLDRDPNGLDHVLDQVTSILEILPYRFPDLDKSEVPDLIAKYLCAISKVSRPAREDIFNYLDSLIVGESPIDSEIAGYTYALIEQATPGLQKTIYDRLATGFTEATDEDREFWTIALAEFASYEVSTAQKSFELINNFLVKSSTAAQEESVCYATEALAKLVNKRGNRKLIIQSDIGIIGEKVSMQPEEAYQITNRQLITYVSKIIDALDQDNYENVLDQVEDFLLSIQYSSFCAEAKEVVFDSMSQALRYVAPELHEAVLRRVYGSMNEDQLVPVISEFYGAMLQASLPLSIRFDSEVAILEFLDSYYSLENALSHYIGAEMLFLAVKEQIEYLKSISIDMLAETIAKKRSP